MGNSAYQPLHPDAHGRLRSAELDAWLATWDGAHLQKQARWLRLFNVEGRLIPTAAEAAHQETEAERQRAAAVQQQADVERQRAEAAEAELARLRALLEQRHPEA